MSQIDRQQAIDKFEPWLKVKGYSEGELNVLKAVLYELRVMPPASAQTEVILCKDCRYFDDQCPWSADPNGFCYKAYRKEEV